MIFGYDFMVDVDLNVWLLEINSSPSQDQGTKVTEEAVRKLQTDIVDVILEDNHRKVVENGEDTIGTFKNIYFER